MLFHVILEVAWWIHHLGATGLMLAATFVGIRRDIKAGTPGREWIMPSIGVAVFLGAMWW